MIHNCFKRKPLPIYGRGANIRDWLYVDDHADAIWRILQHGKKGETYDIGGKTELTNLELLHLLIELIQAERPGEYRSLIRFVQDRAGHDFRYALDTTKIEIELGWKPIVSFKDGLTRTIRWYSKETSTSCASSN